MRDLDELRFDLDLHHTVARLAGGDDRLDEVELLLRVADDELGARWNVDGRGLRAEGHAVRNQPIFGGLSTGDAASTLRRIRCRSHRAGRAESTGLRGSAGAAADEVGAHLVFLGDHRLGVRARWHDRHGERLHFVFEAREIRHVAQRLGERDIRERNRDARVGWIPTGKGRRGSSSGSPRRGRGPRQSLESGNRRRSRRRCWRLGRGSTAAFQFQDDVDAAIRGIRLGRVERAALVFEKFNRLANRRFLEFELGNNDPLELPRDHVGAADFRLRLLDDLASPREVEAADRHRPRLVQIANRARTRFVVADDAVVVDRLVDLLLKLARRDVVGIGVEDLLRALQREVVAARLVEAFRVHEILLHQLHVAAEFRRDRLVVIVRLFEPREDDDRVLVARIVAIIEHQLERIRGVLVAALGDALLGELHAGRGEFIERAMVLALGICRVRNDVHGQLVLRDGLIVVLVLHRLVALLDRVFAAAHVVVAARQFTLHRGLAAEAALRESEHRSQEQRSKESG